MVASRGPRRGLHVVAMYGRGGDQAALAAGQQARPLAVLLRGLQPARVCPCLGCQPALQQGCAIAGWAGGPSAEDRRQP